MVTCAAYFVAKALQEKLFLYEISFAGRKNSEKLASNWLLIE